MADDNGETRKRVTEVFYIPRSRDLVPALARSTSDQLPDSFGVAANNFMVNILGCTMTCATPFFFASSSVRHSRLQRAIIAQRIRAGRFETLPKRRLSQMTIDEFRERWARATAIRKLRRTPPDPSETLDYLSTLTDKPSAFTESAESILKQCTIQIWTSIEVLARDFFVCHLNQAPALYSSLARKRALKGVFPKSIPLRALEEANFDVSRRLGTFAETLPTWGLERVRTIYRTLFPQNHELARFLGSRELDLLVAKRHVLIHRCGEADEQYIRATKEPIERGDAVVVSVEEFNRYLDLAWNCGISIFSTAVPKDRAG